MSERTGTSRRDRGQVAIEYMGFIPLLLLVGLLAIQLGVAAYTANQAGTGARAAARTASHDMPLTLPEEAGREAMSDWLSDDRRDASFIPSYGIDEVTYTARVKIPSVVPGLSWGYAERSSTFPRE
ncbi:TadE/TadG family type IV pilus assembly protein [Streptomyces sp. NPDC005498]|uniref:TadE/TadG family type IV pilus assembly protein n=1 Tax=Streptomyces sp. NPDC005498 TaxID=3364717 RepID=UPI0036B40EDC